MSSRKRFIKIAHFELANALCISQGYQCFWDTTLSRWRKEGLPGDIHLYQYFGFDRMNFVPVSLGPLPCFEKEVIEEAGEHRIVIDENGVKRKEFIPKISAEETFPKSMSQWLEFPVKDRKSWKEFTRRLNPLSSARYPYNWEELKRIWQERDYPLGISVGSFYGWIRNWVGMENLSYMFYDDPSLVREMMEYIEYFILETIKKAVEGVELDFAHFWEDMAYKTASLVSPQMFKDFMLPHYKKVTGYLRSHNIDIITVDSDGNINELIPLWLEGGVNGVLPLEVAAGMDAVALRKKYKKDLILIGNIDKRSLARGKSEIKKEIQSKIPFLLSQGGYFPALDHHAPPDIPYGNYLYYLKTIREVAQGRIAYKGDLPQEGP